MRYLHKKETYITRGMRKSHAYYHENIEETYMLPGADILYIEKIHIYQIEMDVTSSRRHISEVKAVLIDTVISNFNGLKTVSFLDLHAYDELITLIFFVCKYFVGTQGSRPKLFAKQYIEVKTVFPYLPKNYIAYLLLSLIDNIFTNCWDFVV